MTIYQANCIERFVESGMLWMLPFYANLFVPIEIIVGVRLNLVLFLKAYVAACQDASAHVLFGDHTSYGDALQRTLSGLKMLV